MKNLLVYINPDKKFDGETEHIAPIQIDNSLKYFKKEDIIVITNFPYEYNGVKALVVERLYCDVHKKASKVNAIIYYLENDLDEGETTWFHDWDAYQIGEVTPWLDRAVGLTDHGYSHKWNTGSIFFRPCSLEFFRMLKKAVIKYNTDEERALMKLTMSNFREIGYFYERLNNTYNFGTRRFDERMDSISNKIKVLHFHLHRPRHIKELQSVIPNYLIKMFYEYPFGDYRSKELIKRLYEKSTNLYQS